MRTKRTEPLAGLGCFLAAAVVGAVFGFAVFGGWGLIAGAIFGLALLVAALEA